MAKDAYKRLEPGRRALLWSRTTIIIIRNRKIGRRRGCESKLDQPLVTYLRGATQ